MLPDFKSRIERIHSYAITGHGKIASCKLALMGALSRSSHKDKVSAILRFFTQPWWIYPELLKGLGLAIDPLDWSETLIYEEIFVSGAYDLNLVPFHPDVVVDCGSHIGMFSLLAAAHWPGVKQVLFEPNPRNISRLKLNKIHNQLGWELNEGVVAAEGGHMMLEVPRRNSHSARIAEAGERSSVRSLTVPAWNLAKEIERLKASKLVLKLDIEGTEKSLWRSLIPALPAECAIFFETHHHDEGWDLAVQVLNENGFEVHLKSDRGECKDGFALRFRNS